MSILYPENKQCCSNSNAWRNKYRPHGNYINQGMEIAKMSQRRTGIPRIHHFLKMLYSRLLIIHLTFVCPNEKVVSGAMNITAEKAFLALK